MSDQEIGNIFSAVAFPMCMLVLAFIYWHYLRERDARKSVGPGVPTVSALRMAGALREDGASPAA